MQHINVAATSKLTRQGPLVYLQCANDTFVYDSTRKPLGSGAMGIVFRGKSMKTKKDVAIKLVNPRYASIPSIRFRAAQEASMMFRHQNLIEMVGACDINPPHGPFYVISNYVHGIGLAEHVEKNLSHFPDRVARICRTIYPVLYALEYLHENNIVHLDIKPSNIMIESGQSNVRLMDLGISFTADTAVITSAGLLGTPGYAAPEQYVEPGSPVNVDARTDIYELGVTLYELLAGYRPEEFDVLPNIDGVPRRVCDVIRTATAKDPDMRYSSAREMKNALELALTAEPVPLARYVIIALAVCALLAVVLLIILS